MDDAAFLQWIRDRLEFVHGEHPRYGYMLRLEELIEKLKKQGA